MDRQWRAAEGERLTDELVLGKVLGSGFQVLISCRALWNHVPVRNVSGMDEPWVSGQIATSTSALTAT